MNIIFLSRVSSTLGLAALSVICGGLSAHAETASTVIDPAATLLVSQSEAAFTTQATPASANTLAEVARSAANEATATAASESTKQMLESQLVLEPSEVLSQEENAVEVDSTGEQSELIATMPNKTAKPASTETAYQGSAADLITSMPLQPLESRSNTAASAIAQTFPGDVPPAATRANVTYVGVGGSVGLLGDSALGDNGLSFTALSKIGLTRFLSVRPAAVIDFDGNATILVPATFDFATQVASGPFNISPYVGGGLAINVGDNDDISPMLTGGIDVPLTSRFTGTAGLNVSFIDEVDLGLFFGIGYNLF